MWRHVAANGLTLIIAGLVAVGGLAFWAQGQFYGPGPVAEAACVPVPPATTMRALSEELESDGLIENATLFRLGATYSDRAHLLKAGSFRVPEAASMDEILEAVTQGGASTCGTEILYRIGVTGQEIEVRRLDPVTDSFGEVAAFDPAAAEAPPAYDEARGAAGTTYRVLMAEGVTSWQAVEAMRAAEFLAGDPAELPAEGRLAPGSYEVAPGIEITAVLGRMADRQAERLATAWAERDPDLPISTPEAALTLASIVEKETAVAEERPQVASVFVNRLREGMRLQTDPTVIYGITEGEGTLGRGLRRSELRAETDWNTYVIDGLPPTPIANPGAAALRAATQPAETEYLYFVADGTGGHAFATTLAEHNRNVAEWRQIEAQRAGQ